MVIQTAPDTAPLDRAELDRALLPFGHSRMLPRAAYVDPAVFDWEQRHFFDGDWMCVGRSEDMAEPGDQRAESLGGAGVLLTRGPGRRAAGFRQRVQPPGTRAASLRHHGPARSGHLPLSLVVLHPRGQGMDGARASRTSTDSTPPSTV